jgi:F-type H+-transporting ATPase subunit b
VRSSAADVAASAAEKVVSLAAKGALADQLIARGIEDVKKKLN